jgi:D-alanyl-D-alanine carboxypeptidase
LENEITGGNDQFWTFEQAIERTKKMKHLFVPGTKGKANYSDANFQLLGKIIENITHKSYSENCKEFITQPLGLTKTYLYQDSTDKTPKTLYYKNNELNIPKAMTSFGADGGIVSTSTDMLIFIEAFFTGKLFPLELHC